MKRPIATPDGVPFVYKHPPFVGNYLATKRDRWRKRRKQRWEAQA